MGSQTIEYSNENQNLNHSRSLDCSQRSVHSRIQSHRHSRKSGRLSQKNRIMVPESVSQYGNFPAPKYILKHQSISTVSRRSQESNGFFKTRAKEGKIYNDGRVTYYSGRTFIRQNPHSNITVKGKVNTLDSKNSKIFNRTLKDKDTFLSIFPNYRIVRDHKHSTMRKAFKYPRKSVDGRETHFIDRTYTKKTDFITKYTEEMLKIAAMKRQIK